MNLTPQTTLPTEPGDYLFVGTVNGLRLTWKTEMVRAACDASGKLSFVGTDFWWHPTMAVGTWWRVDLDPKAVEDSKRRAAVEMLEQLCSRDTKSGSYKRFRQMDWEAPLGKEAMEILIQEGLLKKTSYGYFEKV